jgi:methylglutaconyl-CoA hydratase
VAESGFRHLLVERKGPALHVQLNRPAVHNAINPELVDELTACLTSVSAGGEVRAVLLSGAGPSFCAGADLTWMRAAADLSYEENLADARKLTGMLAALNWCPLPTVARAHGASLGAGVGLLACCDIVVAADDARFGFSEVKLGILPAVVAPYVVAKIGESHAGALFASGERFDAQRALQIGLVHHVVPADELDAAVERILHEFTTSAPGAAAQARALIRRAKGGNPEDAQDWTAELLARLRTTAEAREGVAAFLEKRRPSWVVHGKE